VSGPRLGTLALLGVAVLTSAAGAGKARVHRVRPGETLSHVALYNFGNPTFWPVIYEANRDQIKDPSVIYPGQQLSIPELDPDRRESLLRESHARNGQ
jgi:nucleoid-associated protein YgaU